VVIAICAWNSNIAFFVYSKSTPSPHHLYNRSENSWAIFLNRYRTGECSHTWFLGSCRFTCLQIRATWEPTHSVCVVLNTEVTTKTILGVLVSDVVLLLTMLVGLLRLRVYGTMFALGKFLWRQVGSGPFYALRSLICFP
jgi:hypothetical protein